MSQAITRCPECQTSFLITEDQLLAANGKVRCGACMHVFQAEDYFVSPMLDVTELLAIEHDYWANFEQYVEQVTPGRGDVYGHAQAAPAETETPTAQSPLISIEADHESSRRPRYLVQFSEPATDTGAASADQAGPSAVVGFWQPQSAELTAVPQATTGTAMDSPVQYWPPVEPVEPVEIVPTQENVTAPVDSPVLVDVTATDDVPLDQPLDLSGLDIQPDVAELVQDQRRLLSLRWLRWLPGILLMVAIGYFQYAFFNMERFTQDLRYRGYYETACAYLVCEVPDFRSPDDLMTREVVIRSHPEAERALIVDLLLRNAAEHRQVFPGLRLQFFNLNGQVIGSRIFKVDEYLGGELRGLKYMPARTEVRISLELVDPGADASGYEMIVLPR